MVAVSHCQDLLNRTPPEPFAACALCRGVRQAQLRSMLNGGREDRVCGTYRVGITVPKEVADYRSAVLSDATAEPFTAGTVVLRDARLQASVDEHSIRTSRQVGDSVIERGEINGGMGDGSGASAKPFAAGTVVLRDACLDAIDEHSI